ncbi:DedA family protein [Saccharopolyspora taberi]|uniref:VTT domain-containing protein n=1 Tax=Saccharopolyspora taberi TaxID=60895 RepID=A0ABN3VIN3_9PSEU
MTDFLARLPGEFVLAVVAVWMLVESGLLVGVFLPGSTTVLALGFLAGRGVVDVPLAAVVIGAVSALGCQYGYLRGRSSSWVRARVGEERMRRLESSLDSRGGAAVAVSQCVGVVRTLVPRLAAGAGVSHLRFTLCNVPVAFAWSSALVFLGAWSGAAYQRVETVVGFLGLPLLIAVGVAVLIVRWLRRRAAARS